MRHQSTSRSTALQRRCSSSTIVHLFKRSWDDHDEEERAHHTYLAKRDYGGLAILAVSYAFAAWAFAPEVHVPPAPLAIDAGQAACTALALHNLYMELFVVVKAVKADTMSFCVGKGPLGRWIWMTHQIIGMQAVHFSITLLAPFISQQLLAGTYMFSLFLGGLGAFVTIQFFLLVYPSPASHEERKLWSVLVPQYGLVQSYVHFPQLFLAVADICFLRHRATLLFTSPSMAVVVLLYVIYCSTYTFAAHVNHSITGHWPYGLMEDLGNSPSKWLQFLGVQGAILSSFSLCLWMLARILWAAW